MPTITTYPGYRQIDLIHPKAAAIEIEDIAWALSLKCRFGGHCDRHYSVAEHSINVAHIVEHLWPGHGFGLWGLLHEGDEAYLPDIFGPLKRWEGMERFREIAARHQAAVVERYCLTPVKQPEIVSLVDQRLLANEFAELKPSLRPEQTRPEDKVYDRPHEAEPYTEDELMAIPHFAERGGAVCFGRSQPRVAEIFLMLFAKLAYPLPSPLRARVIASEKEEAL